MPKIPSTKFKSSKHGQGNFFCAPPPTFKSRKPKPKKLILAMPRTLNTKLRNSNHGEGKKKFTLGLLFLVPRIGDQKQKKLL